MSYTKKIKSIENDLKKSIMDFLKENKLEEISFKNPFKIWVDEEDFEDEPIPVRYIVKGVLQDCCVVATRKTDSVYEELLIGELDIYDLSYAYEQLTTGRFNVVSEIS